MEVDPPASDSGYESVERDAREIPGVTEKHQDFVFHANMAFVTYTRSRVEDPEEFHRYLRESLAPSLPRFEPRVHWRNAREKFRVWIDVKDGREVDTTSINIHKKPENETPAYFLQRRRRRKDKYLEQAVETESREEAETLLKTHFKSWWTEWALSFGRPAHMTEYITATGKYREQRTIRMGIPVIWTCNEDNDVTKDKDIGQYLLETAVIYRVPKGKMLYGK
ncbi:hypothetical protein HRG_014216 [Hirsutella rhossiliensis]